MCVGFVIGARGLCGVSGRRSKGSVDVWKGGAGKGVWFRGALAGLFDCMLTAG